MADSTQPGTQSFDSGFPLYIPANKVEEILKISELIPVIERALGNFSNRDNGGIVQPVRSVVPVAKYQGFLGVMPCFSAHEHVLATKLVAFYPTNYDKGLPTHMATLMVFDPENGSLKAIMDGEVITNLRTAAASAVATKYLANPKSQVLAIIGAGHQARSHYQALSTLFNFTEVNIYSRTLESAEKLSQEIGSTAKACSSVEEAVKRADIIVTVTFSKVPVLFAKWVKPGAHVNAVGACRPDWQEIDPDLMRGSVLYVDSREGAMKESGDVILSKAEVYAEVGEVVNGTKEAFCEKTTVFKSLGMAVEDAVSANLVLAKLRTT